MSSPFQGQGGLRALPGHSTDDDPLIEAIRSLLPERTREDRDHGTVRIAFGSGDAADTMSIPALKHLHNEQYQATWKAAFQKLVDGLSADDTGAVMLSLITGQTALQIDLLEAYSPAVLSRSWVTENLTDEQIFDAFLAVTAAAFPTPVALARVLLANKQVASWVRLQIVQALYTASLQPSTATPGTPSTSS